MVSSAAATVEAYLAALPPERREVVTTIRDLVNAHLPEGYCEGMAYGMIGWAVPLSRFPDTYNGQPLCYVALAAQKNAYSLYLMGVYSVGEQERRLREAAAAEGKKLDMGKSCLRFARPEQLPLAAIGALIASLPVEEFIAHHEAVHAGRRRSGGAAKKAAAKKAAAKKVMPKKAVAKVAKKTAKTTAKQAAKKAAGTTAKQATKRATKKAAVARPAARAKSRAR
jgi:hypothetical protein